ncbi:MAG: hypothetical protein ACRC35_08195 [Angustibacter sp.]
MGLAAAWGRRRDKPALAALALRREAVVNQRDHPQRSVLVRRPVEALAGRRALPTQVLAT